MASADAAVGAGEGGAPLGEGGAPNVDQSNNSVNEHFNQLRVPHFDD